jgi:hypothetical protein
MHYFYYFILFNLFSEPVSNWFEIITKNNNYLICAENEEEMRDWVDSIEFLIHQLPNNMLVSVFYSNQKKKKKKKKQNKENKAKQIFLNKTATTVSN